MKNLVLGGGGFVGEYLINELKKNQKNDIYATYTPTKNIEIDGINKLPLDITDADAVNDIIKTVKPDCIYYLIAQSSVKVSWEQPQKTIEVNVLGITNLLEAVRKYHKAAKILVIGSSEEYGQNDYTKPISENCELNPVNVYAITKVTQEMIAKVYVKAYDLNIVMTRSFNHIGPKQPGTAVISDFCGQVVNIEKGKQKPVIFVGNLSACRDFTNVRDVVRAYITIMEKGVAGEIYNVGSGNVYKIEDILNMILNKSSEKIKVEIDSEKFRPIDTPVIRPDITKLKTLGWKPQIEIEASIDEILNYFRERVS